MDPSRWLVCKAKPVTAEDSCCPALLPQPLHIRGSPQLLGQRLCLMEGRAWAGVMDSGGDVLGEGCPASLCFVLSECESASHRPLSAFTFYKQVSHQRFANFPCKASP